MDTVHFDSIVELFIIVLGMGTIQARNLVWDVFNMLDHDDTPSIKYAEWRKVLRFVARSESPYSYTTYGQLGICVWCGELDELRDVYPITACPTCHQNASFWSSVRSEVERTHTCNVCLAPIAGRVFPDPFGTPMVAFGDCPMGHNVVEQLEALSRLLTTDAVSEWIQEVNRSEHKLSRCKAVYDNVPSMGLKDAKTWVEAHYQDNGSGDPRTECLVCGNWTDECTCDEPWCVDHACSSYECRCAWEQDPEYDDPQAVSELDAVWIAEQEARLVDKRQNQEMAQYLLDNVWEGTRSRKIALIKLYHHLTNEGLKESKDFVDKWCFGWCQECSVLNIECDCGEYAPG